ncbi:hypothetical protein [Robiginitalea biformata]|uniref:Uncharacterized protein n=1 Tax=Robiginitalea biformata (strain ATCC BAA-864 / DSM 15991 / KCTC 12146 / HTCC2501) TaxID=313596 RepID=A4CKR1_ROBBH|nr:hypothetical protein [Robiginitalea biformata]EAR15460.1 hypothetical protein RB2501_14069 [Robiginitalea biformata HTCC2501]
MPTLFLILVVLAIWHFIYEAICAPAMRHGLRYKFFEVRDELRYRLATEDFTKNERKVLLMMDHALCATIRDMNLISANNYLSLRQREGTLPEIQRFVRENITESPNEFIRLVDGRVRELVVRALFINHGGWALYVLPIFVPAVMIAALIATAASSIKRAYVKAKWQFERVIRGAASVFYGWEQLPTSAYAYTTKN